MLNLKYDTNGASQVVLVGKNLLPDAGDKRDQRQATVHRVLFYSTENYIQYHVINQNGKEYEKWYVYMYI